MKNTFYLVRHGESKFNSEKKHQGWISKNPLTRKGILQAKKTKKHLTKYPIDYIYSSPLTRTRQTAKIISAKLDSRISYSKLLLDFRRSKSQEGLSVQEYTSLPEFQLWKKNLGINSDFSLPDGESRLFFTSRVSKFALKCDNIHNNKNILIITHIDVLHQLIFYWTNKEVCKSDISNCVIFKVYPDSNELEFLS